MGVCFFQDLSGPLVAGDDSAPEGDGESGSDAEQEESEDENNHMIAPAGVLCAHAEDGYGSSSSSNLEDMDDSDLDSLAGDDAGPDDMDDSAGPNDSAEGGTLEPAHDTGGGCSGAAASHGAKREKAFHKSPEWIELEKKEVEMNCHLLRLPPLTGCTISRHPAKSFWSIRFPNRASKSASWNASTSPRDALVRCLRHAIKCHLSEHPADHLTFEKQMDDLKKI